MIHYRRPTFCLALSAAALLAGCGSNSAADDKAEAERLMQTSREWAKVAATGDVDAAAAYFTDDAVMISDGQPPVRGKKALRDSLAETLATPGVRVSWEPLEAKVSGDIGYLIERTKVSVPGPNGVPMVQNLQAVTVWRKQPDGSWKNAVDISTPAAPASQGS